MKKFYLLLLLALPISGQLFAQAVPEVLYYKFEEAGTTVTNYATTPPPGTTTATILGSITQGGSNLCGGTLIGSGNASSTDYLNTNWAPNLGTSSWTISFRTSNIGASSTLFYIFGDANTASLRCFTNGVAGPNNWILRGAGMTDTYVNGGAIVAPTMTTFVYDNTVNTVYAYLNGVLVATVLQAGTPNLTGTGPFKVMGYATNVGSPANGYLDDFRIYSHALTAAEVAQVYNPLAGVAFLGPDFSQCENDSTEVSFSLDGSSYLWNTGSTNDTIYTDTAGTYILNVSGICGNGEDTIQVSVIPSTYSSITEISCGDYTAPSGMVYNMTGIYNDTIANVEGCDSIITIDLTVNQPSSATLNASSCGDYTAPSGMVYSTSGTYMDTIPNAVGCDSVMTINLTVLNPSSSTINASACDSFTAPSGAVFNTSGMHMDTIPNAAGCDSVITINLTLGNSSSSSMTVESCGPYTAPSGAVHNSSGVITDVILNTEGCDSVMTITLTVTTINNSTSYTNGTISATQNGATYEWIDCSNNQAIPGETGQTFTPIANGSYAVVISMNNCSDTSACEAVTNIGISENAVGIFEAFPNPTTGELTITNTSQVAVTYVLTDMNGKVLQTITATDASVTLDLSAYSTGVYLVKAVSTSGTYEMRIIKQ